LKKFDYILILDFGSQYTQLIARKVRESSVYCEIHPFHENIEKIISSNSGVNLKGIILSGGPASVLEKDSPALTKENLDFIRESGIPVLGLCYGYHLIVKNFGGKIHKAKLREYGHTFIDVKSKSSLFAGVKKTLKVWMSHGDSVHNLPKDFVITSKSKNGIISSFENTKLGLYGLQFHPEVHHTDSGKDILNNFIFSICKVKNLFEAKSFIDTKVKEIKEKVGKSTVICALSGGVDSSVAAMLMKKAIGNKLICIHIDNGLMRKNESENVIKIFRKNFRFNLKFVDASEIFLSRLKKVIDPEKKRKIIGKTFIEIFEREAKKIKSTKGNVEYLVQGTLYPDVIESVSFKGPSVTIKSHHNVGGLPKNMNLKLIEPLRELFKDEVRVIGKKLGLPDYFINRHPFPGPGLAVRIISDITKEKTTILKEVDDIFINGLIKFGLYNKIWQAFAVLLPVQSVGVMGDERSYENAIALRAVTSVDGMTADFYQFEKEFLTYISNKIINSVKGVNRVVYDISSKPPATIEWE
jgi:GMP synthase (glutamine-hydrolysing)